MDVKLKPDVAQEFEIVNWDYGTPKGFLKGFGRFNFSTMSLISARSLVKKGFPFLKTKTKTSPKK